MRDVPSSTRTRGIAPCTAANRWDFVGSRGTPGGTGRRHRPRDRDGAAPPRCFARCTDRVLALSFDGDREFYRVERRTATVTSPSFGPADSTRADFLSQRATCTRYCPERARGARSRPRMDPAQERVKSIPKVVAYVCSGDQTMPPAFHPHERSSVMRRAADDSLPQV